MEHHTLEAGTSATRVLLVEDSPDYARLVDMQSRQRDRQLAGSRLRGENSSLIDPLTGLCSELVFCDRVTHALSQAERRPHPIAVMVLRIAGLAALDGSEARDELIYLAADSLSCRVRKSDTLARIAPDSFAILLDGGSSLEGVERTATCLTQALDQIRVRHPFGRDVVGVSASIGIAVHPGDGADLGTLMTHAKAAERRSAQDPTRRPRFHGTTSRDRSRPDQAESAHDPRCRRIDRPSPSVAA